MTKEKLRQHCWIMKNIKQLEDQLFEIETRATRITPCLKQDIVTGGLIQDKMGNYVAEMVEIKEKINQKLQPAYKLRKEIEDAIEVLDEREKYLIRMKYINCMKWEDLAVDMGYTWRHMHKLHAKILKKL